VGVAAESQVDIGVVEHLRLPVRGVVESRQGRVVSWRRAYLGQAAFGEAGMAAPVLARPAPRFFIVVAADGG
jgi:hypothetical protein